MERDMGIARLARCATRGFVTLASSMAIVASSVAASYAQAVIVDPSSPGTSFLKPSSGVARVNIAAPRSGVSLNKFTEFNVGSSGLILNNSRSTSVSAGGQSVPGNSNLSSGTAKTIVTEVTGSTPTSLKGETEVVGTRAAVLVANPNGIVCDGCSFVNSTSSVLTTGSPTISSSGGIGLTVTKGTISIGPQGFEPGRMGGLLGRHVEAVGPITSNGSGNTYNDILIVGGAHAISSLNLSNLTLNSATAAASTASTTSPFAIDIGQAGTLTSGYVKILSEEEDLATNVFGDVTTGAFLADVADNLYFGNVDVSQGWRAASFIAGETIRQYGTVDANRDVEIRGRKFKLYHSRQILAGRDIEVALTENVTNLGDLLSGRHIDISSTTRGITNFGLIFGRGTVTMNVFGDIEQYGYVGREFNVTSDSAVRQYVHDIYDKIARGDPSAVAGPNSSSVGFSAGQANESVADQFLDRGTIVGKDVEITSGKLINYGGAIVATRDLSIDAGSSGLNAVVGLQKSLNSGNGCSGFRSCGYGFEFKRAELLAGRNLTISSGGLFQNRASDIAAGGDITIAAVGDLKNAAKSNYSARFSPSRIVSLFGSITLSSEDDIFSDGSILSAAGDLVLTAADDIFFRDYDHIPSYYVPHPVLANQAIEVELEGVMLRTWVPSVAMGRNIKFEAGDAVQLRGAKILAARNLDLAGAGSVSILDSRTPGYFTRTETRTVSPVELGTGATLAARLFGASGRSTTTSVGRKYVNFLKDHDLLLAVQALRYMDSSSTIGSTQATTILNAARSVSSATYSTLIDDSRMARLLREAQTETATDFNLREHDKEVAQYLEEVEGKVSGIRTRIGATPANKIAERNRLLSAVTADYNAAVTAANSAYTAATAANLAAYGSNLTQREKQYELQTNSVGESSSIYRWVDRPNTFFVGMKAAADQRALSVRDAAKMRASVIRDIERAKVYARYGTQSARSEINGLSSTFNTKMRALDSERTTMVDSLKGEVGESMRIEGELMEENARSIEYLRKAIAFESVGQSEKSLATAISKRMFPEVFTGDHVTQSSSGIVQGPSRLVEGRTTRQALITTDKSKQDAFLEATEWRFASGATGSGNTGPAYPWNHLSAEGTLRLASGQGILLEDGIAETKGRFDAISSGNVSARSFDLAVGEARFTAVSVLDLRATRIESSGNVALYGGASIHVGARLWSYLNASASEQIVGELAVRDWTSRNGQDLASWELSSIFAAGDLSARTPGNLVVGGASLEAGDDILLSATGKLEMTAPRSLIYHNTISGRSGETYFEKRAHVAKLDSGGNIVAMAGGVLALAGSDLEAGGAIDLSSGGNLELSSAENFKETDVRNDYPRWYGRKYTRDYDKVTSHIGTSLLADGDIDLESTLDDLKTAGARLESKSGDINVSATDGDMLVGQFTNVTESVDWQKRSFSNLPFHNAWDDLIVSEWEDKTFDNVQTPSEVLAGINLTIASSGNMELIGAQLRAGETLNVNVGGDLIITDALTRRKRDFESRELGGVYTDVETLESDRQRAVRSTIEAGGDVNFSVGGKTFLTLHLDKDEQIDKVAKLLPDELLAISGLVLIEKQLIDRHKPGGGKSLTPAFVAALTSAFTFGFGTLIVNAAIPTLTAGGSLTATGQLVASFGANTTVGLLAGEFSGTLDVEEVLKESAVRAFAEAGIANAISGEIFGSGTPPSDSTFPTTGTIPNDSWDRLGVDIPARPRVTGIGSITVVNVLGSIAEYGRSEAEGAHGDLEEDLNEEDLGYTTDLNGPVFISSLQSANVDHVLALGLTDERMGMSTVLGEADMQRLNSRAACATALVQGRQCSD